jgi:hypothetical protein
VPLQCDHFDLPALPLLYDCLLVAGPPVPSMLNLFIQMAGPCLALYSRCYWGKHDGWPRGALPTFATNHFGNIAIGINVERTPEVIETRIGIAGPIARIEI